MVALNTLLARREILIGAAAAALVAALISLAVFTARPEKTVEAPGTPQERIAAALDPCAEGRGDFARSVCDNTTLAALDGQVRDALVAEAASVSDAGAQMLVQNEQRWRDAQRIGCGIADPAAAPDADQQRCLESEFRARVQDAGKAVEEIGGYTFQRVELVDASPMTAAIASASGMSVDDAPDAVTRDIRFPRIDAPQTPQIQRFNQLVAQQPQYRLEEGVEEQVNYAIAYAGPKLISVRFDLMESTLSAAHPNSTSKAVTVLMDTGEPLTADDVFRANSGWQRFITRRALAELTRQFREYEFTPPERDVRESATKAHLWLVTENALVILFPPYSFGGPHALGGAEVAIPWADLRPYLNPEAPPPIGPVA
jgi:Protein of unknown function (DUF3298)